VKLLARVAYGVLPVFLALSAAIPASAQESKSAPLARQQKISRQSPGACRADSASSRASTPLSGSRTPSGWRCGFVSSGPNGVQDGSVPLVG
jgi:hypothetical protein